MWQIFLQYFLVEYLLIYNKANAVFENISIKTISYQKRWKLILITYKIPFRKFVIYNANLAFSNLYFCDRTATYEKIFEIEDKFVYLESTYVLIYPALKK